MLGDGKKRRKEIIVPPLTVSQNLRRKWSKNRIKGYMHSATTSSDSSCAKKCYQNDALSDRRRRLSLENDLFSRLDLEMEVLI